MSESKFKQLQEDVCDKPPEEEPEPDRICPTCIPNENYMEPDWRELPALKPYLNEKTCEYEIKVLVNIFGETYIAGNINLPDIIGFKKISDSEYDFNTLLKTFIRPGIRGMLRYYDKLETDEIVCASPPTNRGQATAGEIATGAIQGAAAGATSVVGVFGGATAAALGAAGALPATATAAAAATIGGAVGGAVGAAIDGFLSGTEGCQGVFGLDYEGYISNTIQVTGDGEEVFTYDIPTVDPSITDEFPEITNLNALELFARPKDYHFHSNSRIMSVLVSVPAYKFDQVPSAPDLGAPDEGKEKVVLKSKDFITQIIRFRSAFKAFKKYQSYFKHNENASLFFKETQSPFYISYYADSRIDKFVDKLVALLDKNNFNLPVGLGDVLVSDAFWDSREVPDEIEITFNKSDENNPFVVENVRARVKGCEYVKCGVGLNTFIDYSRTDQTMLAYIANIREIDRVLSANKTPPWLDFTVKYTFPELAVNYGSSGNYQDSCLEIDFSKLDDFILNETMGFFEAFEYRYNQNYCKDSAKQKKTKKVFSNRHQILEN